MVRLQRTHSRRRRWALVEALEPRTMLSYTFSSLVSFRGAIAGTPPSGLVMDGSGNLFGVTAGGGAKGYGAVFEVPASTGTMITLANFTGANGIAPRGQLVLDAGGELFGTTTGGGASNKGTVFEINVNGSTHSIVTLASFDGTNGSFPMGGIVSDGHGHLIGTAMGANSAGFAATVFQVDAATASGITRLATLKPTDRPTGAVVVDSSGTVFGTTNAGGANGKGSIFQIAGSGHTLTTLASFNGTNGTGPDGTLLLDSGGNLIGLTSAGGANSDGTLFKLAASSSTITTLATFNATNGNRPIGNLFLDSQGNIFGSTTVGGANSVGTIFERAAGTSNTITTLYAFKGQTTGYNPTGFMVMDALGSFWGETYSGGTTNSGTLFKLQNNAVVFAPPPTPTGPQISTAALQLVVTQQPVTTASGKTFALIIKLEDALGQVVNSGARLTLSLASGPAGGTFGGTRTVSLVHGVATFSNLVVRGKGSYTLEAVSGSLSLLTGAIVAK